MSERLFLATKISEEFAEFLSIKSELYSESFDNIRLTPKKNLHITLIPPSVIRNRNRFSELLDDFEYTKFNIEFNLIEKAPKRPYRLLWAKTGINPKISKFKAHIFGHFNYSDNRDDFIHVTLARIRSEDGKYFKEKIRFRETISNICIYKSELLSSGAKYEILEEKRLL